MNVAAKVPRHSMATIARSISESASATKLSKAKVENPLSASRQEFFCISTKGQDRDQTPRSTAWIRCWLTSPRCKMVQIGLVSEG